MRNVPDPETIAEAFDNKFCEMFEVDREHSPRDTKRSKDVTVIRTEEGQPDEDSITGRFGEPWHEVYRFFTANGYYPVEGEEDYVIFSHPKDKSVRRMQSQYSDVYVEKYSAWEYTDKALAEKRLEEVS